MAWFAYEVWRSLQPPESKPGARDEKEALIVNPNKRRMQRSRAIAVLLACLMIFAGAEGWFTRVDASEPDLQQSNPEPIFAITWTATANGFSDTTDNSGIRTVERHRIVMTGSSIERRYANGTRDEYPFQLTVTDDSETTTTGSCPGGGSFRSHEFRHITNPDRYMLGPDRRLYIYDFQRADGSWYIEDPFEKGDFYLMRPFTYRFDDDSVGCDGTSNTSSMSLDTVYYSVVLSYPAYPNGKIAGDANGNVFTIDVQRQSPDSFVTSGATVHWTVTVRRLLGRDLTVERLEVTQGLQDDANSIPLVRGRRTVVRAYLGVGKDQVPINGVTGKLRGYTASTNLGSMHPFNPGGRITAPVIPDWQQINDTLNFELPYAWTQQPALTLKVEVNDDRSVTEIDYTNNQYAYFDTTLACRPLSIAYRSIHYEPPGGYSPSDPSPNIAAGQEFMRKIYPVADKDLSYQPWIGFKMKVNVNDTGNGALLLGQLLTAWWNSSSPKPDHMYGWLPSQAAKDNGQGQTPGQVAFGNDTESPNRWRRTFAHEIGHNFGLPHSELTTAGRHWFDVYERRIKPAPGNVLLDVMQPERLEEEAWISPTNYLYLISKLCGSSSTSAAPAAMQSTAAGDNLIVSGIIISNTTPAGTLNPLYRTSTAPLYIPPPPQAGPGYCVKLKDNTTLLNQYCFDVGFDSDGAPASMIPFGMVVTYPVGLNRVELTRGTTTLLSSRVASANAPTVTVTFPNAAGLTLSGNQNIQWTGSDADGDPLTYNILYSRDNGATWIGVASDITTTSLVLDFAGVPGSSSGRVKVQVSDGFNSAEDASDNPFSVANKPPTAAIISPPANARFNTDETVVLQGSGLDLDDGSLGDSALTWRSTRDGALGTGRLLEKTLSAGRHTITVTATDSGGLSHSTSIQVSVAGKVFLPVILR
jgi:hypothetical protein